MTRNQPTTNSSVQLPAPATRLHSVHISGRGGILLGVLAVTLFSLTPPATRVAVLELGGTFVGLGRALVAGVLAAVVLIGRRDSLPPRRDWLGLVIVAVGCVIGFPVLTSLALRQLPSSHAAVLIGLLPAATAVMAVLRAHERPAPIFWVGCAGGVMAVILFAIAEGAGRPRLGDLLLLVAVVLGGAGYAEGGRLARTLGGWRVICWALVLAWPWLVVPVIWVAPPHPLAASAAAWVGFAYVSVFSMFVGFVIWYAALARGGVARIGQIQLSQPVLTLFWSALLLKESVHVLTVAAALLVIVMAAVATILGRRQGNAPLPAPGGM